MAFCGVGNNCWNSLVRRRERLNQVNLITPLDSTQTYCLVFYVICAFGGSGAGLFSLILAVRMWAGYTCFLTHKRKMRQYLPLGLF